MNSIIFFWTKNWLINKKISAFFLEKTSSSNDYAKNQAFKIEAPFSVFLTGYQTSGRGRGDRRWKNSDLMISFCWSKYSKKIELKSAEDFSKDLKQALNSVWPKLPVKIKPPNDLYLDQSKAAGILLEVLNQGSKTALIVGLGLNVFSSPKDLSSTHLSKYIKDIKPKKWNCFLENLFLIWNKRAGYKADSNWKRMEI